MSGKLKFKSVYSLVIGSQIGSGVFLLPASLALLGPISLFAWFISGAGAILLALVFGQLSMRIAKGGGPHVYVEQAFGKRAAFFTAWTYWLVSWVSSLAVILAAVGYLSSVIGITTPLFLLAAEMAVVIGITYINIRGSVFAGSIELFLTIMKCIPLIVIPLVGLFFLKVENFFPLNPQNLDVVGCLNTATLMTFWGFVGLETATTTSGIIENPTKTVPKAVLLGTLTVAAIYFLNSFGIMGILPIDVLAKSQAPYVTAAETLFGQGWNLAIAGIAFIACLGTLNAWVLTSGQIAVEAAKEGLFPPIFARTNRAGAPYVSLLIALICTLCLLILTLTPDILTQLNYIIDLSVTTFLFIYLGCALSFIKLNFSERKSPFYLAVAAIAALFCCWVLFFTSAINLILCSLFVLSGIPIYFKQKKSLQTNLSVKSST